MTTNRRFFSEFPPPHALREAWLTELLSTMDIPDMRRDITDISNVRWLLRNIQVRNSDHKDIDEVLAVLHTQRKHLQKGA
jgi:hypothetical protein